MSASREKSTRRDLTGSSQSNPKTAHEAKEQKAMKRSNLLYGTIAVAFVVVAAASIVWRSNVIPRNATAATINGEKYTASEMTFYYQNIRKAFMTPQNYQILGMLGVDMNAPLDNQTMNDNVAAFAGAKPGQTWKEFFTDKSMEQIASVQAVLKAAEDEGFVYPDSVQATFDQEMASLKSTAAINNLSVNQYLQNILGRSMTEKVYRSQLMDMLKYQAYLKNYEDSLTYSDEEIEAAYQADPKNYDKVAYETVRFSGVPAPKTDDEGNPIEATEEETNAAMAEAKSEAEKMLTAFKNGKSLETLAEENEKASYANTEAGAYIETDAALADWLFADGRKDGQATIVESGNAYILVVFHDHFRQEDNTIDVRHILIRPAAGKLTSSDEGYDEEQAQLKADARAKADDLLAQWAAGEATEDSFAKLAMENSADGSAAQGGIYTQVVRGQMVPTFNDWCFDASRQPGDTGVVDTDFGSHVMYFVGTNLPQWKADVVADLKAEDYEPWVEAFSQDASTETSEFGMRFVG